MHFEELHLIAYGPFTDRTLKLNPGFNVLFGPNEAGKSSALRAIYGFLYGIGARTSDNFVHSNPQLRIGATLADREGNRYELVRRKGNKATLRDRNESKPVDEQLLTNLLGGASEDFFSSVFGIDHERLREGGEDVIRGKGRIGELLFAAGGVAHLREKQKALTIAAGELFKPTGSKPSLNQAISRAKALKKEISDLQRSPEDWTNHHKAKQEYESVVSGLTAELDRAETELSRLSRIESAMELLSSWKAKRAELDGLAAVSLLSAEVESQFARANQDQIIANTDKHHAEQRIKALEQQASEIEAPKSVLKHDEWIDGFYRRLGSHEKAAGDLVTLKGRLRQKRNDARGAVQRLGWSETIDDLKSQLLSDDKKARVRALAGRYGEVKQACEQYEKTRNRLQAQASQLKQEAASSPPADPPKTLTLAIERGRITADSSNRLARMRAETSRVRQDIANRLSRLQGWEGSIDELVAAEVPSLETIDRFDEEMSRSEGARKEHSQRVVTARASLKEVQEELAALELVDSVPTEVELRETRQTRDRGLQLAAQSLQGQVPPTQLVEEFVKQVNAGAGLAGSLQPSVQRADDLVDRLRREADRVAKKSQLLARLRTLEEERDQANLAIDAAEKELSGHQQLWEEAWSPSGISPSTPAEMRAWVRQQAELIGIAERLAAATEAEQHEQDRRDFAIDALRSALRELDSPISGKADLDLLTDAALQQQQLMAQAVNDHKRHEENLKRLDRELQQNEVDREAAIADLRAWQGEWTSAVAPLKLAEDALPEQAEAVIGCLDDLSESLGSADSLEKRIFGIEQTAREFDEAVREFAGEVAPELADQTLEEAVYGLYQRLTDARELKKRQESLSQQLLDEKNRLRDAEQASDAARALIQSFVVQAGCDTLDRLPEAIEKSRQKLLLIERVEELSSQLSRFCSGKALEEFAAEVGREDVDRLPVMIEELRSQIADIRERRDRAIAAKQREESKLEQFDAPSEAADKAIERQFELSKIEADARTYVVTLAASRLLQKAIERYQEKTQGPVLSKASDHFAALTRGTFRGLKADLDGSGEEILVGVRADNTSLMVEAMSEGTRDQVFFALRLGTIDHWLDQHTPVPIVFDDILLAFDDERAEAALQLLIKLAGRTQILFFTHHEHVVSLARRAAEACQSSERLSVLGAWGNSIPRDD